MNHLFRFAGPLTITVCSLVLVTGLGGCFKSKHPLAELANAEVDPQLVGTWTWITHGSKGNRWVVTTAGKPFPSGLMRVENSDAGELNVGYFFTTRIGEDRYINWLNFPDEKVPENWDPKLIEDYTLLHYDIAGDVFTSTLLDTKYLTAAMHRQDIPSDPSDEFDVDSEKRLTADTVTLRAFFEKQRDRVLSKDTTTAKRVP